MTAARPETPLSGPAYLRLIVIGAAIGIPAALLAAVFLALVHWLEDRLWTDLPARLGELLAGQPEAIRDEIISINDDARHLGLQAALLFTLIAALAGVANAFRMLRLPDPEPSTAVEGMALG